MGFTEISWLSDMDFESCLNEEKTLTMMTIPTTNSPIQDFTDMLNMMESYESPTAFPDQIHLHNNNSVVASPIILNFENGNTSSSPGIPKTNDNSEVMELRALNPDEEALVTQVLRSNDDNNNYNYCNMKEKLTCIELKRKRSHVRLPLLNQDHVIAERKRREQLSQKFRALSTMIPGLKKLDKASVLGDTITYLKQLQDKVKALEEQATKRTVESFATVIKKSLLSEDDDQEISIGCEERSLLLPEIKAIVCNRHILIKIQCRKGKGVLVNLLDVMEKHLKLNILSNNATCFGSFVLCVTVVAKVGKDYDLTIEQVVKKLRRVIC